MAVLTVETWSHNAGIADDPSTIPPTYLTRCSACGWRNWRPILEHAEAICQHHNERDGGINVELTWRHGPVARWL